MLFGFDSDCARAAGTIVFEDRTRKWTLERDQSGGLDAWHLTGDESLPRDQAAAIERLRGSVNDAQLLSPISIPKQDRWAWLSRYGSSILVNGNNGNHRDSLTAAANLSLTPHGKVLERLGAEREELLDAIASLRKRQTLRVVRADEQPIAIPLPEPKAETPKPVADHRVLIADLKDELRRLQRQIEPLRMAVDLAPRWRELQELESTRQRVKSLDLDSLERSLAELQSLDQERHALEAKPVETPKPKKRRVRKRNNTDAFRAARKLLSKREWVLDQATAIQLTTVDEHTGELQHAIRLLEQAESDHRRLLRQLHDFNTRTGFDWSTALVDDHSVPQEIGEDSPLAHEPPERQLAELKRRRLWVREEFRYLVERQQSTHFDVWIAILFILSVAALFGILLVASPTARWILTALGFGGIVSSGALKMSLDLPNRAQPRPRAGTDAPTRSRNSRHDRTGARRPTAGGDTPATDAGKDAGTTVAAGCRPRRNDVPTAQIGASVSCSINPGCP